MVKPSSIKDLLGMWTWCILNQQSRIRHPPISVEVFIGVAGSNVIITVQSDGSPSHNSPCVASKQGINITEPNLIPLNCDLSIGLND
ncbi:hypothetical protein AVEN_62690-1 [Araneus ventricosus]|uniref:Uncharacterized protein n=1 Tax=Araneus ventricosus TaxID=182803 RepID=A0A4Y2FK54_ARAVE|nr:hypothetical protein AVEN_62690-1 [Araneus ventricosus]